MLQREEEANRRVCSRDGPVEFDSDDDFGQRNSAQSSKNEIFADDPWNAICVLGLRVYSLDAVAKVTVVKGEGSS